MAIERGDYMGNYDASSIEKLTFKDAVRQRIGIYLGSADHTGVLAGLLELVNNATDEALVSKEANQIEVTIWKDKAACRDYGRGMPHGKNKFSEEVMIDLLTENHSGAKFDAKAYGGKSRGLNGTGSAATCCSSDWFEITSYRDDAAWYMKFEKGVPLYKECVKRETSEKQGTYIIYKPSQEVFSSEPVHFDYEEVCEIMKEYSYFNKGITFVVKNGETGEVKKFMSKNGLIDFAKEHIKKPVHKTPIHFTMSEDDIDIEIILQWTNQKEKFYLFSNGGENPDGGTPITGIRTAITTFMKKYLKGEYDSDMVRTGLVYICSVNLKDPVYDGQTKTKITNPSLRGLAQRATGQALNDFSLRHKKEFDQILEFLTTEKKAEQAAERARRKVLDATRDIEKNQRRKVFASDKLKDAEFLGEDSTLLIVEGE